MLARAGAAGGYHSRMQSEALGQALGLAAQDGLMPGGSRILLAVSGGADSLGLLVAASEQAGRHGWLLAVGNVHHGWRAREAERDLAFVR